MPWPTKKLGEIIDLNFGERITRTNNSGDKFPVYGGGGESFRTDNYNRENEFVISRFAIAENCVRFVEGKFWLMDSGGTFSVKYDFADKLDKNFIGNVLLMRQKEIYNCARGGAQKNIDVDFVKKIKISLPPLEIQKEIVEKLDKIAAAQKLNDELIQKTDELFQSLLHKELNPAGKDWEVKKIKDVAVVQNGGTPNTKNPKYWNGKILWLTPKELSGFEGTEIFGTERKISDEGLKHSSAALLPVGTVLFTSRAPIGYVAVAGAPMATNQGFKNFVCDTKQLNNKYLYFFLRLKKSYLQSLGRGATFTEISKTIVEKVNIPLPPLEIQKKIAKKLSAVQNYKAGLLGQKAKLKELFDSAIHKSLQN